MGKNRKTVLKKFDYTQCDDFASYLQTMAASGWHFKEWGAGLVFEKGQPQDVTYSVEVFVKGSEEDLRPGVQTLEFAEYCQAAGWELVDAKRKFCIFKRVREDAVPILTARERVCNAAKAQSMQKLAILPALLYFIFIIITVLARSDAWETIVLSDAMILTMVFCPIFVFLELIGWISLICWKVRAMKRVKDSALMPLCYKSNGIFSTLLPLILLMLYLLAFIAQGDIMKLAWIGVYMGAILLVGWILAKFRPNSETSSVIRIGTAMTLFIFMMVVAVIQFTAEDGKDPGKDIIPLQYSDLGFDNAVIEDFSFREEVSILASRSTYYLHYGTNEPMQLMNYSLYQTRYQWILDRFWDESKKTSYNDYCTDCSDRWAAVEAYRNKVGTYYVRYHDSMLIIYTQIEELSSEQIDEVRDLLQLR